MSFKEELAPILKCLTQATLDTQSRRIFHGRGRCYPGLEHVCIDWFNPAIVVTLFSDSGVEFEKSLIATINDFLGLSKSLYVQRRYLARPCYEHVTGPTLKQLFAQRGQLKFCLQLQHQNIGYFLDAEPARIWLEQEAKNKRVLNLFSYTCSFSLVASAAGAESVLNMDLSSKSLSLGRESYRKNELSQESVRFYANDILKSWSRLKRFGPYDIVIIDPPSFQKGSFIERKDYEKVLRRMASLTASEARVLCCLNSPEVNIEEFKHRLDTQLDDFEFEQLLKPSSDFPNDDNNRALKMFVYKKVA